jgi:hypothetical protein
VKQRPDSPESTDALGLPAAFQALQLLSQAKNVNFLGTCDNK